MTEPRPSPCRVLIANQDGAMCRQLAALLREAGYEPITVQEGTTALQTIQQGLADVAVLDLLLPGLNALEILPAARRVAGGVPLLVTGLQSAEAVADIIQWHGAAGYLALPASKEELTSAIDKARQASPSGAGRTILVVEDNDRVRLLVCEVLTRDGYAILDVGTSEEALRLCEGRSDPLDLLVADVQLPRIRGPQLFQQLAPGWPALKVLYLSGLAAAEVVSRGWVKEGVPLLEKPFTPAALLAKVKEVLGDLPAPGEPRASSP